MESEPRTLPNIVYSPEGDECTLSTVHGNRHVSRKSGEMRQRCCNGTCNALLEKPANVIFLLLLWSLHALCVVTLAQ